MKFFAHPFATSRLRGVLLHQLSHQRRDLFPHRRIARGEDQIRLEPVDRIADVVTLAAQDDAVNRLAREKKFERVGELNLAAFAGRGLIETFEDRGRE